MTQPLLVLAVGNPSRGDDALGPAFAEALGERAGIEVIVDHQLQVELGLDLRERERVLFVDASVEAAPPFHVRRVVPARGTGLSHAVSPEVLIGAAADLMGEVPPAWALGIRGEAFALGEPLSARAAAHLRAALLWFAAWSGAPGRVAWRLSIEGRVQGVGMRPWVLRRALALGLDGSVRNTGAGVEIDAAGPLPAIATLLRTVQDELPAAARLDGLHIDPIPNPGPGFRIGASATEGPRRLTLVPDLGLCSDCLADSQGAGPYADYAHTSCAACGPRFAITATLPWDRANTSMAGFVRCEVCEHAYTTLADRRFHAEASACGRCGPRTWLARADGTPRELADPAATLADDLVGGQIVAVQGVGAFHLVVDATQAAAVEALRTRKRRETRPFAVMVANLAMARRLAVLDLELEAALEGGARPIVVAPAREGLPACVSGGTGRVGVMLPSTALYARLAALVGRPLVVTSANLSGQPAIIDPAAALRELGPLVDGFCLHDRPILRRVEDSVLLATAAGSRPIRRARGLAPTTIRLALAAPEPILAVGGHLKNTVTVVLGDRAYVGPHLGDLDSAEAEAAWLTEVEGFERLLGVRCAVIAHDLHPDYATTHFALARGGRVVGVQHHAAHAYATLAEHPVDEPVVAVILDGTGWGPDGTGWGAEVLVVDGPRWTRVGTARPLPLPGGEAAIRAPYRAAIGLLVDTFGPEAGAWIDRLPVFAGVPIAERRVLQRLVETGTNTPRARGIGRAFDAVAALILGIPRAGHEAQLALALEEAATGDASPYPHHLDGDELDLRPAVRELLADLVAGVPVGQIATRYHEAWIAGLASLAAGALARSGLRRVVLSGGAMANDRLLRGLVGRLGEERVLMPRELPVNDGGLSLGQAWSATLHLREEA